MSAILRLSLGIAFMLALPFARADVEVDPPGRVARLNYIEGSVTFSPAGSSEWSHAGLNRPLTSGDQLWVDDNSRAELHAGSTAVRLAGQTQVSVLALDDDILQLKLTQGSVGVRVRNLFEGQSVEIDTPNLAFVIHDEGSYRIDVQPEADTTRVVVRRGEGDAIGANDRTLTLQGPVTMGFTGDDLAEPRSVTRGTDDFDGWIASRDAREDRVGAPSYVSPEMTGYEDLDDYGTWRDVDGYGPVWTPRVVVRDWAPYRFGHWVWIAPWGWTWVDDAPWGFAPFHYGRWAWIHGAWGWVPGPVVRRPVYAPALVVFASGGNGGTHWGLSLSVGPSLAWCPLGPGEAYRPAYTVSRNYITEINRTVVVRNTTVIHNIYVNQRVPHAITAAPANAFVRGQPIQHVRATLNPDQLRRVTMGGAPRLAPVQDSVIGGARRVAPPPRFAADRQRPVVAVHPPIRPAAANDSLARRFADQGAVVKGAGPLLRPDRATPAGEAPRVRMVTPAARGPAPQMRPDEQRPNTIEHGAPAPRNDMRVPGGTTRPGEPMRQPEIPRQQDQRRPAEAPQREQVAPPQQQRGNEAPPAFPRNREMQRVMPQAPQAQPQQQQPQQEQREFNPPRRQPEFNRQETPRQEMPRQERPRQEMPRQEAPRQEMRNMPQRERIEAPMQVQQPAPQRQNAAPPQPARAQPEQRNEERQQKREEKQNERRNERRDERGDNKRW